MKPIILYPCEYGNINKIDEDYKFEQEIAQEHNFITYLFNYDDFIYGAKLKLNCGRLDTKNTIKVIYRGWMMNIEQYTRFYNELLKQSLELINTPEEYKNTHYFVNSYNKLYNKLNKITPKTIWFEKDTSIDWNKVRNELGDKFIVKDYVKSVKGFDFPEYLEANMSDIELDNLINKFIQLRGELYQGGIVLKQYVELDKSKGHTHEFRAFYSGNQTLCVYNNSNNKEDYISKEITTLYKLTSLDSNFYTMDFARLENGEYTVIEIGDGQVSGLPSRKEAELLYTSLESIKL